MLPKLMYSSSMSVKQQGDLFDLFSETENIHEEKNVPVFDNTDIAVISALHSSSGLNLSGLPPAARRLHKISSSAFESIVYARMSELPISAEISRYERKILAHSADSKAADAAASDHGDPDVAAISEAVYKVWHEIHRLMGLLRFSPNEDGVYIAHCEPDHFVLPALGPHFKERFGEIPWAIIDEKRRLCMRCTGSSLEFINIDEHPEFLKTSPDSEWENLWRHYHKTINNESRNNPELQKRFMPKRYWKYLNELDKPVENKLDQIDNK